MEKNIEVEIRSFLDDCQFLKIKSILDVDFEFVGKLCEITVYFSGEKDLRLRKNEEGAFLILKEGKIHDDSRKEYEVRFSVEDWDIMMGLLFGLGYEIEIKWLRNRLEYKRGNIKILLDDTVGYGKILEIEEMVEVGQEEDAKKRLTEMMGDFGILEITGKEEFNKKFEYYKENWRDLIV